MRSGAEQEIRDAVVAKIRACLPDARVIHELNAFGSGSNRIDVAAVTRDKLFAFEIKSEKDTLKRWPDQKRVFEACSHFLILAAHRCHFELTTEYSEPAFKWPHDVWGRGVWMYPDPTCSAPYPTSEYAWELPRYNGMEPHAYRFLETLWAAELKAIASRLNIDAGKRPTRHDLIVSITRLASGREIAEGVCEMLRRRSFAEADKEMAA